MCAAHLILDILVEHRVSVVLHKLTLLETVITSYCDGSVVFQVILTTHLLDGLRSFLRMVEGHLGEEVVAHVCVSDVVQAVVHNEAERSIHGTQSSTEEIPLLPTEVRNVRGGMLEVGDEHQVVVGHHQRRQVVRPHAAPTEGLDSVAHNGQHTEETGIGLHDEPVPVGNGGSGGG